jgi:hypothetical protein
LAAVLINVISWEIVGVSVSDKAVREQDLRRELGESALQEARWVASELESTMLQNSDLDEEERRQGMTKELGDLSPQPREH